MQHIRCRTQRTRLPRLQVGPQLFRPIADVQRVIDDIVALKRGTCVESRRKRGEVPAQMWPA
jgi:hypothetical protein